MRRFSRFSAIPLLGLAALMAIPSLPSIALGGGNGRNPRDGFCAECALYQRQFQGPYTLDLDVTAMLAASRLPNTSGLRFPTIRPEDGYGNSQPSYFTNPVGAGFGPWPDSGFSPDPSFRVASPIQVPSFFGPMGYPGPAAQSSLWI